MSLEDSTILLKGRHSEIFSLSSSMSSIKAFYRKGEGMVNESHGEDLAKVHYQMDLFLAKLFKLLYTYILDLWKCIRFPSLR